MECTIDWGGPNGMLFTASTGSGHVAVMDGAVDGGGHNLAPPARWKCCWPAPAAAPPTTWY